jgi:hypothetical protein
MWSGRSGECSPSAEAPKSSGTGEISAVWLIAAWDICCCVLGAGPQPAIRVDTGREVFGLPVHHLDSDEAECQRAYWRFSSRFLRP